MLNRTGESFGHIAVQVAILVMFTSYEQVTSGRDLTPSLPPAHGVTHTPTGVASDRPRALGNLSGPFPSMVAPGSNLPQDLAPLLAQIAPSSRALAGVTSPQPEVPSRKPVNETVPAPAGAKPSGHSVKPHRFKPRVQSAANPADPYIVAQAAALNNNATQIFAFVRDQIGFQVYKGSLRGARGTLWSKAGNSLDRASLLIALLGAAGITAQYVEGTISPALQQQLILSMFSNAYQLTGCPPPGSQFANPGSDPSLRGIVSDHFWVEFGPSLTPADPSFAGATIGTVNGTPTNTFTSIPAALQHTVTFRLDIEEYEAASALFGLGDGISTTEVLNQTFATTDLVGEPVTVANLVSTSSVGLVLSATTFTYTPYLRFGADPTNPSADTLITGQEYQETYTNFPLGNQILTGIFLNMDVNDPGSATQTYQRAMLDRIGYAARQNGTSVSIAAPATPTSAVTPVDMMSVNVLGGYQDPAQNAQYATAQLALDAQMTAQSSSPVLQTEVDKLSSLGRAEVTYFASQSDISTSSLAEKYFVAAYQSSPRLLLFKTSVGTDSQGNPTVSFAIDLRKDDVNVVAPPQQVTTAPALFNVGRGIFENGLESQLASAIGASISTGGTVSYSTASIISAAQQQNLPIVLIQAQNASLLNTLQLSPDALARISNAIQSGLTVMTPTQEVTLNGVTTVGWYQFDPTTGETIGVLEDGGNQAIVEATLLYASVSLYNLLVRGLNLQNIPPWLKLNANQQSLFKTYTAGLAGGGALALLGLFFALFASTLAFGYAFLLLGVFILCIVGILFAFFFANAATPSDRQKNAAKPRDLTDGIPPFPVPPIIMNLGTYQAVTAGAATGVTTSLSADPTFTVPLNSSPSSPQLPLAFMAQVKNTGGAGAQFNLTIPSAPSGFTVESSGPSLLIPAGATGQIEVCFVPSSGSVPAAGTNEPFSVTATASSPPSVNASANGGFVTPAVQALSMTASPTSATPTPGSGANVSVQIQSIGNQSVTASLASNPSGGLSESGLGSSVTIAPGQSSIQNLVLTPAANATIGVPLTDTITATFGTPAATVEASISITPTAVQAQAAAAGSTAAAALGRTDIATVLSNLSSAINTAISSCSPAAQTEVLAYVNNLIQLMNAPFLANFASQLQTASAAIAAATCATLPAALTQLSNVLASLATALSSPAAFPFNLTLQPNSAIAQPGQASSFLIVLQNNSTTTNTYSLSLGALPGGVTGSLSSSSVTLAPGASIPVNNANNNPTVTITPSTSTAFQFALNASINGVSGSTQTALGTMTARSTFLQVQDVIATPGFTNAGGSVDVTTHIANVVNQNKTVQVKLVVNNSSSVQVLGPFTQTVALSVTSLLTTVDFGQINTTGLANGNYTLAVSVIDPVTNTVMPGGTGTGGLLIGSPVTATLTVSPQTIAPGNATVMSTLTVSSTTGGGGGAPFSLIGSVATASAAVSVAINGNTVYTCDNNEVTVINATNPTNPTIAGTAFAGAINNAAIIYCDIQRGDLVMLADTGNSGFGNSPSFIAFDLTTPLAPSLIASTIVDKRFFGAPYYQGNTAFFGTDAIFLSGSTITGQAGDFVSLDVTNFSTPAVLGTVETQTQGSIYGGSFNVYGVTPYSTTLAYATSTTSQGNTPQTGTGQLWAVNTTNPAAMSIVNTVNVPGTIQLASPLVQGNTAVAIGDTGGWRNPDVSVDAFLGNIVIAVFDLTNPQSPQLVANVPTTFLPSASFGSGAVVIGPHLFLYAGVMDGSNNQYLMLVDTTNPASPVITTYLIPAAINVMRAVGTLLYAPTSSGLQIYSIPGLGAIQYTAAVQIAKNANAAYNAGSFSVTPTSVTPGSGADTVTWVNPASNTITWTSNVTGIQPAQVLPIDLGGTVSFTTSLGSGTVTLPQADVNSGQILGLAPGTQTVAPGLLAAYTLTVNNPTSAPITYNLAVTGVSQTWVTLQSSVTVPASGSLTIPLNLRSTLADIANTYNFTVTATSGGTSGSVQGTMILVGTGNIGATGSSNTLGVQTTLIPTQATGGQGTPTTFTVQLTNAGNVADTYTLSATTPAGITATFSQPTIVVPPGLSNFRQVLVQVTAARGTAVGPQNFTVTATSQTNSQIKGAATGTLNVVAQGVSLSFSPASVNPGGTLHLTVTNLGSVTDTFSLALGGPAAVISMLAANSVTLGPNQSQQISVAVGAAPFAVEGSLALVATATGGVTGTATATVVIPSSQGVSAAFNPTSTSLSAPGPATLLLQIQNTGTIQDSYVATIISTSGPTTASLVDITGQSVQTTSVFILPGTAQGELVVNATLTGSTGSVTVKITSQTNPAITATAVGLLNGPSVGSAQILKSFGAAAIALGGTTSLSFTVSNPNSTGTLSSVAFTDTLPGGLAVATPNGLTGSCGGGTITATAGSSAVSLAGATFAAGASCTFSVNVTGTGTGPQNNSVTVTSANGGIGNTSNASVAVISTGSFLERYAANLSLGESYINITNTGANGAPLLGPGFGAASGNICVDVYAFDPGEELISCCSCLVTPDQTVSLGVNRDLTVKTLTGVIPTSLTVKLLSTLAGGDGTGTSCTNSAATATTATIAGGLAAWGTTLHSNPTGGYDTTEAPFTPSALSPGELASVSGRCAAILGNGSGFGVCNSCRTGALGGTKLPE